MEGVVVAVRGPVIDVDFENYLPDINEAVEMIFDLEGTEQRLICEVAAHLGDGRVRTIAMDASDGIKRGQKVTALQNPIQVPVGEEVLGRIFDVIGNEIDEGPKVEAKQKWSIHRDPPNFDTCFERFCFCILLFEAWRISVNRPVLFCFNFFAFVDFVTDDVKDPSKNFFTDRYFDRALKCCYFLTTLDTVGGIHRDRSYSTITQVSGYFTD